MMYPLEIPLWVSIAVVIVLVAGTAWVFFKDGSPRTVGLMSLVVGGITALAWFTNLPVWTALLVIFVTTALFVIGMFRPDNKDNAWHFGALGVALVGKALFALVPWVIGLLDGSVSVPKWLIALVIFAAIVGIIAAASKRAREWITHPVRWFNRHLREKEPEPTSTN